jgi:replicative DNA helicase
VPEAPETIEYYTKRLYDRRLYSQIRDKFNDLKEKLREFDMDEAREIIDEMRAATRIAHTESDIRSLREAVGDVMREYAFSHENPGVSGIPTGWPRFDNRVGGYQPGDLVSWVARPNMGKTYNLLRQASGAWQFGYNVMVVTMEMTIEQITRRLAAMQAGINPDYIRKGTLSNYAYRRLESYIDGMANADRFKMFSGGLRKKVSDVEVLVQEYSPDIVFIDGVYMMQPESKRATSKVEKVSEVYDELKKLTLSQNIPVVVTTQFNRTAGKRGKEGSLENIAFSDAISTHSSLVISLHEGKAPNQTSQRVATFLKGREGETGSFDLHYTFAPINFEEVDSDSNGEDEAGVVQTPVSSGVDWMA